MVSGFSGFSRWILDSAQDNDVAWKKLSLFYTYIPYNFLNLFLPIFLQQYTTVPQTPLLTSQVLKEETEQWPEVQQEMSMALKVQYS